MDPNHQTFSKHYAHLSSYEWIHNFQVKDIFKVDVLSRIPTDWLFCLSQLSTGELNEIPFIGEDSRSKYPEWPVSLHNFLLESSQLSTLRNKVQESSVRSIEISHDMARGMNPKKMHEVTKIASLIYERASAAKCNIIVDVGSGLGYLDHVLHQKFGLKVLGMEIAQSHASAAEKRAFRQGITCGGVKSVQCRVEDDGDSYKEFVTAVQSIYPTLTRCECEKRLMGTTGADTDSDEVQRSDTFRQEDSDPRICLIGLHCCGDLSTTMMSYFSSCDHVKAICCVCCCYHKMAYSEEKFAKFPLSDHGKMLYTESIQTHGQPFITPFTLRLGAQETRCRWRQQTEKDHEDHIHHVAFRGLLSLTDEDEQKIRQKIRKSKFDSFQNFVDSYYGSSTDGSCQEKRCRLMSLYDKYKKYFDTIEILTLLQVILQPVIETLIYQDRAQWLKEKGHENVDIVHVFDEMISPRNLAIVAIKKI